MNGRQARIIRTLAGLLVVLLVVLILVLISRTLNRGTGRSNANADQSGAVSAVDETGASSEADSSAPAEPAQPPLLSSFSPHAVEGTEPNRLISYTGIMVDGEVLSSSADFNPWYQIDFGAGSDYTDVQGVITFRGNSFRDDPTYGTANMTEYKLQEIWTARSGSLTSKGKTWTGSGWTGQPLLMKWPRETKAIMNMYDWAKEDDELVEVIYACMDGNVYFLDLRTGRPTRDALHLGYTFKGAGALDPRGYPILYVGAGYNGNDGNARVFVVSLVDGSVQYTFGNNDSFAGRNVTFFDSSPLVDAASDTLIYPGESGLLYLIHLNTQYDPEAGTLTIDPDRVCKWKYMGNRTGDKFWLGMEDSAAIYGGYLYIADNGGNLMCLNLNTMELVWAQDTLDDTNTTPVLSVEDGRLYLYISTSFHLGWRSSSTATIPIWKIDAETGEIIWQRDYECHSKDGVSGGVQSTIAVGKNDLDDYIYVTVSMTENTGRGVLACLDKGTGEVVWEHSAAYAWSSPVCVYNSDGSGAVMYCSSSGRFYLLNGKSGAEYDMLELNKGTVEASPAVYDNYLVLGTRDCQICGLELK